MPFFQRTISVAGYPGFAGSRSNHEPLRDLSRSGQVCFGQRISQRPYLRLLRRARSCSNHRFRTVPKWSSSPESAGCAPTAKAPTRVWVLQFPAVQGGLSGQMYATSLQARQPKPDSSGGHPCRRPRLPHCSKTFFDPSFRSASPKHLTHGFTPKLSWRGMRCGKLGIGRPALLFQRSPACGRSW